MSVPARGIVLAAGLGVRMRPLTLRTPKPLLNVADRTLLDRAIDRLEEAGVEEVVVNIHHHAEQMRAHCARRTHPRLVISDESATLLETGGGVRKALPLLGEAPFYVVNADNLWLDAKIPALVRLAEAWVDSAMDALLLLQVTPYARGYAGMGDFFMDPMGQVRRRREREVAPYVFTGVQILHPRAFQDTPEDAPFSLNLLYDRAEEAGRLWGIAHDGDWFHVGTPSALADTDDYLRSPGPRLVV